VEMNLTRSITIQVINRVKLLKSANQRKKRIPTGTSRPANNQIRSADRGR
jgi:hypothetical protein